MARSLIWVAVLCGIALCLANEDPLAPLLSSKLRSPRLPTRASVDSFVFLDNGIVRIGIDTSRGGSVGWFGPSGGDNFINIHDFGRETQVSYYTGPQPYNPPGCNLPPPPSPYSAFPYNPIGAGDLYGNAARILSIQTNAANTSAIVTSIPQQWACNNTPAEGTLVKTLTLVGAAAEVTAVLTLNRPDHTPYPPFQQELPAVYVTGAACELWAYVGDAPYTGAPAQRFVPPQPADGGIALRVPEQWVAMLQPGGGPGVGLWHPETTYFASMRWNSTFSGCVGGPYDDVTGYVSGRFNEVLDWDATYAYNYSLVWGDVAAIRAYAGAKAAAGEAHSGPDWSFAGSRAHFTPVNANSSIAPAWAALSMPDPDPQWHSGYAWWDASAVPMLYVTAAYGTAQHDASAQLFYCREDMPDFDAAHVVDFDVQADGVWHTYAVALAGGFGYSGVMVQLRLDPVIAGQPGAWVNISRIAPTPPTAA